MRDREDLPTVDAASIPEAPPDAGRVAGVLLAAGASARFGDRNKLLAAVDGEPIVRRAARTLVAARVDPVVAVLGHEADRVAAALDDLPIRTVRNEAYRSGQASSVRAGIEAVRAPDEGTGADARNDRGVGAAPAVDAAVIALGDMPSVDPGTVDALADAYDAGAGDALAAAHDGIRGNPVLFDRRHFDALAAVEGDVGGRRILLDGDGSALVNVDDPGVLRDVDERSDL